LSQQDKPTDAEEIISEFQKSKEESKKQEPEPVQEPKNETIIDTIEDAPKPETTETTETVEPQTEQKPEEPATEAPEEPATEAPEEPATEAPEEPATEAPKEPATEAPKEPATEAPKEPATEAPKEPATEAPKEDSRSDRSVIFVGKKPLMTYVTATLTQLAGLQTVTIKARGRTITQAVDVSQMIVKRMNTVGFEISDVRIASDSLESQDGRMRNVSTIEIDVSKK